MSKTRRAHKKVYDPDDYEWDSEDDDRRAKQKLKDRRLAKKIKNALKAKELEATPDEQ